MTSDGNFAWLRWMLELAMAAFGFDVILTICFYAFDDIAHFHP